MMPSDAYRLYQAERVKGRAEIQRADEQAARLGAAVTWLVRAVTRAAQTPAVGHGGASRRGGTARLAAHHPKVAEGSSGIR